MESNQGRIVFLSVPESLRSRIAPEPHDHDHRDEEPDDDDFTIDPSIPIPVELRPGETNLDLEELSWEMIISGMLRVISAGEKRLEDPPPGQKNPLENNPGSGLDPDDIDYYRRFVLSVRPRIRGEFTEAAILHARNGDFAPALEILDVLQGLFPRSPALLLNRALVLENQAEALERAGRETEAEAGFKAAHEGYRRLLALEPPFPDSFFNAAFFYMKRHNFDQARECFISYLPLSDDDEKRLRAERFIREIEKGGLDDQMFREAYDLIRLGEEQEGMERIRDFIERHSGVWNGWFILGWALRRLGRWEDGAVSLRKAVDLGGGNSDTRNELAICLMEKGDYAEARKELESALREEPENVKIISNLGVLSLKTGNAVEAAGFFRTVLEIEPGDPIAKQYLESSQS
ncbi:MAG: tetratricopeptide repeat protein [Treponema sp.]|jgi:tetratricopeptide (TPR) repeat protein|nr:tetratricopeptide repeat protein [Treponema sp.]